MEAAVFETRGLPARGPSSVEGDLEVAGGGGVVTGRDRDEGARTIMAWTMAYQEALVRRAPEQWVWWRMWRWYWSASG